MRRTNQCTNQRRTVTVRSRLYDLSRGLNKSAARGERSVFQGPRRVFDEIWGEMEALARLHFEEGVEVEDEEEM